MKYETDDFMAIVGSGTLTEKAIISSAVNKISKYHMMLAFQKSRLGNI